MDDIQRAIRRVVGNAIPQNDKDIAAYLSKVLASTPEAKENRLDFYENKIRQPVLQGINKLPFEQTPIGRIGRPIASAVANQVFPEHKEFTQEDATQFGFDAAMDLTPGMAAVTKATGATDNVARIAKDFTDDIVQEAKKYKSAEDLFSKPKGVGEVPNKLIHLTHKENLPSIERDGFRFTPKTEGSISEGISLATKRTEMNEIFGDAEVPVYVKTGAKSITLKEVLDKMGFAKETDIGVIKNVETKAPAWAAKNGYDILDMRDARGAIYKGMDEIRILNPSVISTKPFSPTQPKTLDPLLQEARKYKSAEEFVRAQKPAEEILEGAMQHRPSRMGAAHNIERNAPDFYQHPEYYDFGGKEYKESIDKLMQIKDKPNADIAIYRASPKNELRTGDWVTLSREKAKIESMVENTPIQKFNVKAKDLQFAGDDITEFGYWGNSTKMIQQLTGIWNKANKK